MIEYRYNRLLGNDYGIDLANVAEQWINGQIQDGFDLYQLTDGYKAGSGEGFVLITMVRYA